MTDEIFYLEGDEEITSVIDKIRQAKASRISLVVPREATILQSVVNLKIIAKEANRVGKEIAIITADKIGRNLAAQVGLPVLESLKSPRPVFQPPAPELKSQEIIEIDLSQKQPPTQDKPKGVSVHHFQEGRPLLKTKERPNIESPWPKTRIISGIERQKLKKIIGIILTAAAVLIITGLFLIWPKTDIIIKVEAENFQKTFDLKVIGQENPSDNMQAAEDFKGKFINLTREKEAKFPATGRKNLGGKASGTLSLYNYWDSNPQNLGVGTKFSSSSKTFLGKSAASIPGTSIRGGNIVPGTASVEIEAENPGEEYNVPAGRFTIVGLSSAEQEKIYGQSNKDITGGFSKEVSVVSESDFNGAKEKLTQEVSQELEEEFSQAAEGLEVLEKAKENQTLEAKSSVEVEGEANDFNLKVSQRQRAIVFEQNNFRKFVFNYLEKQIPYDKMLTLGPDDQINPRVKETKYDEQVMNLEVSTTAKMSSRLEIEKIRQDLKGKSKKTAEGYLQNLNGTSGFEIRYHPSWWLKRISFYQKYLKLELEYIEKVETNSSGQTEVIQ